jgi:hypothetical protein
VPGVGYALQWTWNKIEDWTKGKDVVTPYDECMNIWDDCGVEAERKGALCRKDCYRKYGPDLR